MVVSVTFTGSGSDEMTIASGRRGQTLCPLRPYGRIEIEGKAYEAKAENGWIDERVEVVVVDTGNFGVLVRESEDRSGGRGNIPEAAPQLQTGDEASTDDGQVFPENPFHGPAFWLERVNAVLIGALLWTAIGALLLLGEQPLSLEFLLLPVGGAISGAVFQYFIRGSRDLEGPYSDHRPKAYFFVLVMLGGAVIAVAAAFSGGGGVATITAGLIFGTLCGGIQVVAAHML